MAKCNESLQPEVARYLCRVRTEGGNYRGYKKDILTENLSERDNAIFVCPRCKGILRELCISTDGEQFCSCCKKEGEQTHPNIHMNNAILCFKCYCPLLSRGCDWLGTLGDCENHLDTCGYVQEMCKLKCGVVLQRNDHVTHEKENCVERIVKCEHCEKNFKFCGLTEHLDVCPKVEVSCELKCGLVMCRDKVVEHIDRDCKEKEIECPFAKYKCVGLIKRQYLDTHLEEKETVHLKLKVNAIEDIVMKQIETIADQGDMIIEQNRKVETMSQEIGLLKNLKLSKGLLDPIYFSWELTELLLCNHTPVQKEFAAVGFIFQFGSVLHGDNLQINLLLKEIMDYGETVLPFRAKFITRLILCDRGIIDESKSEVIEKQKEDLTSKFRVADLRICEVFTFFIPCGHLEMTIIFC